jgi:hypothetical protein
MVLGALAFVWTAQLVSTPAALASPSSPSLSFGGLQKIDPAGYLDSISCPAAGDCVAVGFDPVYNGTEQAAVAEEQAGTWRPVASIQLPADANPGVHTNDAILNSVSCSSAGNCAAVGTYSSATLAYEPMVVDETGGVWGPAAALTPPANAAGGGWSNSALTAVSCPADGACVAVGTYWAADGQPNGPTRELMVATEVGGVWQQATELAVPNGASSPSLALSSVDCTAIGECEAVGASNGPTLPPLVTTALSVQETAGVWGSVSELANQPTNLVLNSVSCWAPGDCEADGQYAVGITGYGAAFALESDGVWSTAEALPNNYGSTNDFAALSSITCPAAQQCLAVGSLHLAGLFQSAPLVYSLDNGTIASNPNPVASGPEYMAASAASCALVTSCSVLEINSAPGDGPSYVMSSLPAPGATTSAPGAGATGSTGTGRGVTQSTPKPARASVSCVVPQLVGQTVDRARRELRRAHCRLGKLTVRGGKHAHGSLRVLRQSARPHSVLRAGYRIDLEIKRR